MAVDIACVGFGPATAGFLTTLSRRLADPATARRSRARRRRACRCRWSATSAPTTSASACRASVTRARGIRAALPRPRPRADPDGGAGEGARRSSTCSIPSGASRRSAALRAADRAIRALRRVLPYADEALELPWTPGFLHKQDGLVLSMGQLMQWMGAQVLADGAVQIWPSTPVERALVEDGKVRGVRLLDQGVDRHGRPGAGYLPGMDVLAGLTVVADGPVGAVGRQLDAELGMPPGHGRREWAVGMKFVVDLPEDTALEAGTVLHTFGFPEPEIFGFLYVHPERVASVGIFVPSWFGSPGAHELPEPAALRPAPRALAAPEGRAAPLLGREVDPRVGPARRARPRRRRLRADRGGLRDDERAHLVGRRRGVHHRRPARRGRHRAPRGREAAHEGEPGGRLRRAPPRELGRGGGARGGAGARRLPARGRARAPRDGARGPDAREVRARSRAAAPGGRHRDAGGVLRRPDPAEEIARLRAECEAKGVPLHDALMDRAGWPAVPLDGKLLVSQQDALLMGGKVQAPRATPTTSPSARPRPAGAAAGASAWRSARPRRSAPARTGSRASIARSASTAERACGAAPGAWADRTR